MSENQISANLHKNSSVLISGGSGLIGRYLTTSLLAAGYRVSILSRTTGKGGRARVFIWDPENRIVDPAAFEGIDFVINLAGANIGEKLWTKKRKEEIRNSRVDSTRFLYDVVLEKGIRLKAFISASAVGIYGSVTSDKIFCENDVPSIDFLGDTCMLWEDAADLFESSGIRTVKVRTAVVLEKSDSALSKLMRPGKFGFLIQTGNGRQYMPWIHINDLCNIYLKAIEDSEIRGPFNAVAPEHVTNREFIQVLAKVMKVPVLFSVPDFIIRASLGEMSDVILKGSRISSEKILNKGYRFSFNTLEDALNNVIR
ncbi:MAG TPA: TIGR01777 family oxidoreductase [Bacteroidales bacterium]